MSDSPNRPELPKSKIGLVCSGVGPEATIEERLMVIEQRLSLIETMGAAAQAMALVGAVARKMGAAAPQKLHDANVDITLFMMHLTRDSVSQQLEAYTGQKGAESLCEALMGVIEQVEANILALQKKVETGTQGPSRIILAGG